MNRYRHAEASTRTKWAFRPEHVYDPSPGCYLQLPRGRDAPWELGREEDLFYLNATLVLEMGFRLSGGKSATAVGRFVVRPGVSFETARRRWRQLERCVATRTACARSNSIVEACKRDILGRNEFIDHLLNDDELIWQLVGLKDLSIAQLESKCSEHDCAVVSMASQHECEQALVSVEDAYFDDRSGMKGWSVTRMFFTCLCRAQSEGDIVEYARSYERMIILMSGLCASRRTPPISRRSVNELMFSDFLWEFGRFLQDWYSRIHVVNASFKDIRGAQGLVCTKGVEATWQVIEPDPPARQFTGLCADLDELCRLRRKNKKPEPKDRSYFPYAFLDATRHVRRHPERLKWSWPKIAAGDQHPETGPRSRMTFDGYIRRNRVPRGLSKLIRKDHVRRAALRRSRRGPGLYVKRRATAKSRVRSSKFERYFRHEGGQRICRLHRQVIFGDRERYFSAKTRGYARMKSTRLRAKIHAYEAEAAFGRFSKGLGKN